MRILYSFLLIPLFVSNAFAQLYVSNNSYVYNKGGVVYSKGNVELNGANSFFYLRNEGQLLQGTTGTSTNKGIGKLSVYQEGTVNNYAYNYWCSPIGNASTTAGNEDFGITMLNVPTTNTASTAATMITSGYDGTSSTGSLGIATYWIWKFLSSATYSQWFQSSATTNISAGQGFTMKGTSGTDATNVGEAVVNNPGSAQRYDFRGKPNDGNITVNVGLNNYTLTGNPYPSALHVNAFLLDAANTACTGIAYYWEQDKTVNSHLLLAYRGGYGTYAPISLVSNGLYVPATFDAYTITGTLSTTGTSSGLSISRKYAPIGQGFMVKGAANGSVTLNNSHRAFYKESTLATSHFEKNNIVAISNANSPISHIRLNTIFNNLYTRQVALAFLPQATDDVDRGIDAVSPAADDLPSDSYFFLQNDKYVIQGINFNVAKRLPFGVKTTATTTVKFNLADEVAFDTTQPVYVYDDLDGSYHNLKESDYEVTLLEGIYNNRFQITFMDNKLGTIHDIKGELQIVQNNTAEQLMVSNPNLLDIQSLQLFDITGKLIHDRPNVGTKDHYELSTALLSDGVYLVKIKTNDAQTLTQKIIITSKEN